MRSDGLAPLDSLSAVWRHDGTAREAVGTLKYQRRTAMVTPLADAMSTKAMSTRAMSANTTSAEAMSADVVTWCPASSRRLGRGFDQSELLARAVASRLGLPCRRTLVRGDRSPQTARSQAGRFEGPKLRFVGRSVAATRLLLIDDVATTGATLRAAAGVLVAAGASEVHGLVATRVSPRRSEGVRS